MKLSKKEAERRAHRSRRIVLETISRKYHVPVEDLIWSSINGEFRVRLPEWYDEDHR